MDSISDQIKECKARIVDLKFQLAVEEAVLARLNAIANTDKSIISKDSRPTIPDSIVPHIKSVLRESGKAMRIVEIASEIKRKNVTIEGKTKPKRLISSALTRRNDIFERVDRGLYKLKTEAKPIVE